MYRTSKLCLLAFAVFLVSAAEPSWKQKPCTEWNDEDANQVLAESPWVRFATPRQVRDLSIFERRDGGDWDADIPARAGFFGTGIFGAPIEPEPIEKLHAKPPQGKVLIRWESAFPVRTAERKAGEKDVPPLDSDDYAVAVYDIPMPNRWNLARELRGLAFLKRDRKKDMRPSRVRILRYADGTATVVYLFPRSVEIAKKDGRLEFVAQIGRLVVSQYFNTEEMQLQDEMQLLMPSDELRQAARFP
jgi:hypothetical protein